MREECTAWRKRVARDFIQQTSNWWFYSGCISEMGNNWFWKKGKRVKVDLHVIILNQFLLEFCMSLMHLYPISVPYDNVIPGIDVLRVNSIWLKSLATRLLNKISSHSFPPSCALLPHFPPIYCNYFAQSLHIVKLFLVPECPAGQVVMWFEISKIRSLLSPNSK